MLLWDLTEDIPSHTSSRRFRRSFLGKLWWSVSILKPSHKGDTDDRNCKFNNTVCSTNKAGTLASSHSKHSTNPSSPCKRRHVAELGSPDPAGRSAASEPRLGARRTVAAAPVDIIVGRKAAPRFDEISTRLKWFNEVDTRVETRRSRCRWNTGFRRRCDSRPDSGGLPEGWYLRSPSIKCSSPLPYLEPRPQLKGCGSHH